MNSAAFLRAFLLRAEESFFFDQNKAGASVDFRDLQAPRFPFARVRETIWTGG